MATDLFAATRTGPMTPWEYIRICREAAGLTIAQAARPYWHRPEHRADVEATTAIIEQPGTVLRKNYLVDDIRRSVPNFDPDVYRQLRDEPADRHPEICTGCGCTSWSPSITVEGFESTIADGTCTDCAQRADRRRRHAQKAAA